MTLGVPTPNLPFVKTLREELRQGKPFRTLREEAALNIARTDARIHDGVERLLAPYGLSATQYNVLRILRGAGMAGLCRNEVRDRLLTRMPDVTRLLDRMEAAGLIERVRDTGDRRMVNTTLTAQGKSLVDSLDNAIDQEHLRQLGHLSNDQLQTLIDLLSLVRNP